VSIYGNLNGNVSGVTGNVNGYVIGGVSGVVGKRVADASSIVSANKAATYDGVSQEKLYQLLIALLANKGHHYYSLDEYANHFIQIT
jgi:hypothetical protein